MDKENLLKECRLLISELESENPEKLTVEYNALVNLRQVINLLEHTPSRKSVQNAIEPLERFCIEYLDWSSILFKRICQISKMANDFSRTLGR